MKVGDLVRCYLREGPGQGIWTFGVIVSFGQKGSGGKDFVTVMVDGKLHSLMAFDVEVVDASK